MNFHINEVAQLAQQGTSDLLSYLDRLKTQAEELLRGVRGVYIKTNLINDSLKMKYEEQIPLEKNDYVIEIKFIDDHTIFILYTSFQYTLYDIIEKKIISSHKFHSTNYSNLQSFHLPQQKLQQSNNNNNDNNNNNNATQKKYLISFFDLTLKNIQIYDLQFGMPISYIPITDGLLQESLVFKLIEDEIVVTYKKGDFNSEEDGVNPIQHSYLIYGLNQEDLVRQKFSWYLKTSSTFTLGGLYNDKVYVLKNKSLILFNSFTRSAEPFMYQEYKDDKVRLRQRESPLQGQVVEFIEFSNSNKIGFIINLHSDSQFKFIVHDLDQITEITEQQVNFLQITKSLLITKVFCFIEDRYIGLSIQNLQYGARNIIYDIENQQIITILQGFSIPDTINKPNKLRLLMHDDDDTLEHHSLKIVYFMKPKITLMKYLVDQGILKQYGEQACKEIIEMIH